MAGRSEVTIALADLASGQWGLFTTSQARREGLSAQAVARLAARGYLERLRHGVYRIGGTPPGPRDMLQAAWLALRPDLTAAERLAHEPLEVVSHRSAAQLHQLGDVDADRMEFTTPARRQARDKDIRFHRGAVTPGERTFVEGLPVTTPLRTIVDLADTRLDGDHLAGVVRDAITTLHLDTERLAGALRPYAHRYGAPLGDGHALLADLLQRAGIPQATRAAAAISATPEQRDAYDSFRRVLAETGYADRESLSPRLLEAARALPSSGLHSAIQSAVAAVAALNIGPALPTISSEVLQAAVRAGAVAKVDNALAAVLAAQAGRMFPPEAQGAAAAALVAAANTPGWPEVLRAAQHALEAAGVDTSGTSASAAGIRHLPDSDASESAS